MGAPVTAGDWRLRAVATLALGFPSLVGGGKLSQTSDRLTSCGFADWQSRPSSATGAGGFEVLIANCKIEHKRDHHDFTPSNTLKTDWAIPGARAIEAF